ncbi:MULTISPECIES: glycosyltransferase [Micromonospora]|uniref:Glycosyltransferase family 2 protein n=1 Tax=Micromonospora chalcea TaxID=1874 RepID=A0ABX9XYI1_MICCH|nr:MULTISPECIES: glycosyltransferase family 2 protein [Micromonospora]PPA58512.1 glycosyl transferase family 2 [Micromonospora chalcea]RQW89172.1 glycosyltransferase family 2 protein [Micromonospora chalcea]RQX59826.1 glycosyltransferase family 2 protein [Micromonospora chalcea]
MDVSIVVLAWEDFHRTRDCVLSLPAEAEIVVVDNGSSAEIREALSGFCAQQGVTYVQSGSNLGYARGMNLGVRHTSRANVILSNNDIVVHGDAVARLLTALEDPEVGAAFPAVVTPEGVPQTEGGRFLTMGVGLGHATGLSLVVPRLRIVAPPEQADWLTGPFVALRRSTFDAIGGVDETSFFYSEDMRLCWAVRRQGKRLAYVADAVIMHEDDATAKRRWSAEEISERRTREFIRASRDLGGRRGRVAATAYVCGILLRAAVGRDSVRRAIARGAVAGLRAS